MITGIIAKERHKKCDIWRKKNECVRIRKTTARERPAWCSQINKSVYVVNRILSLHLAHRCSSERHVAGSVPKQHLQVSDMLSYNFC